MLHQTLSTDELLKNINIYTALWNKGGLKKLCLELLQIICNCEL